MNKIENKVYNNSLNIWISCLVTNSRREILMVFEKESNSRKLWWQLSIIFWKIENWETPKQASIREVKEESGFEIQDVDFLWKKNIYFFSNIYSLFMFKSWNINFSNSDFAEYDTTWYQFMTKSDLLSLSSNELRPGTLEVIICSVCSNHFSNININIDWNSYNKLQFSSLQRLLKTVL